MSVLIWVLRGIIFIVLLGLAIKNSNDVALHFYFDASWQAPLSMVVLVSLAAGVVLGLLALLPQVFRQRRRISGLQRQIDRGNTQAVDIKPPPTPTAG